MGMKQTQFPVVQVSGSMIAKALRKGMLRIYGLGWQRSVLFSFENKPQPPKIKRKCVQPLFRKTCREKNQAPFRWVKKTRPPASNILQITWCLICFHSEASCSSPIVVVNVQYIEINENYRITQLHDLSKSFDNENVENMCKSYISDEFTGV